MNEDDLKIARGYLNLYRQKPETTSVVKNSNIKIGDYDLTVIIPCYNEEKYIKQCLDSIVNQGGKYSIKTVIIDDGSTDDTVSILETYAKYQDVVIIHQENQGLSAARNRGLNEIESRYVFFVDADDYLLENSLEGILDIAVTCRADIVEAQALKLVDHQLIRGKSSSKDMEEVSAEKLSGYAWGKIIKSELFQEVCFPKQYLYEDTIMKYLVYPRCQRMVRYNRDVYVYRINPQGITAQSRSRKESLDTYWVTELMLEDMGKLGIDINEDIYKLLLNQIALNYIRTVSQDINIKVAIYMLTLEWFEKLHDQYKTDCEFQSVLEKALVIQDYSLYEKGCRILWTRILQLP